MIGDKITPKPEQTSAAEKIHEFLMKRMGKNRVVVSISGESGSGKSEIAVELARFLERDGIPTFIFQQDDYFYYPPKTNDRMRRKNIKHVGLGEVNLKKLDEHVKLFRQAKAELLKKPVVIFEEDRATSELIDPREFKAGIVEGTYTALLNHVNFHVFIDRTYEDTRADREARNRDPLDDFLEQVLEIEHGIISRHATLADIIVGRDYSVRFIDKEKVTDKEE